MAISLVAGIYCLLHGIFSIMGKTIFFTKRVLEQIAPEKLNGYLKESGVYFVFVGFVFLAHALIPSLPLLVFWGGILIGGFLLARCNGKYTN